jgi:hypothetical protein
MEAEESEGKMRLPLQQKQALTDRQAPRCRQAKRKTKTKILDVFVETTGYHRKYSPQLPAHWGKETFLTVDGKPIYGPETISPQE